MRKSILILFTLMCIVLTGCGEKSGTTMVWKNAGFKVTISTTEDAVVVPESCNMRSIDGFIVKVIDGNTARERMTDAKKLNNFGYSVQETGNYVFNVTFTDYTTETPTEEIDYVIGLDGVDLAVVVSALEGGETYVDISRLMSFMQSLKIDTSGSYTPYNWDMFASEETEQPDKTEATNDVVRQAVMDNPALAQEALGKDTVDSQEDYDKIVEYANEQVAEDQAEKTEHKDSMNETVVDFNFNAVDSYATLFSITNTAGYTYGTDNDNKSYYLSTDGNFVVKPSTLSSKDGNAQAVTDKLKSNYKKYTTSDGTYVGIDEESLDAFLIWDVGDYVARFHVNKQATSDSASLEGLKEVLGYLLQDKIQNLYTFDETLASQLGIKSGYKKVDISDTSLDLTEYHSVENSGTSEKDKEKEEEKPKENTEPKQELPRDTGSAPAAD